MNNKNKLDKDFEARLAQGAAYRDALGKISKELETRIERRNTLSSSQLTYFDSNDRFKYLQNRVNKLENMNYDIQKSSKPFKPSF